MSSPVHTPYSTAFAFSKIPKLSVEKHLYFQLRLFQASVISFMGSLCFPLPLQTPVTGAKLVPSAPPRCSALLHPLFFLAGGGWKEKAYVLVSLFMLYCALGIHVDESGSPEERQSGDGTSFPESPDLSHVGITAAFQHRSY